MPGMRYQPQGLARINPNSPLAKGLVFLAPMVGGNDLVNLVGQTMATAGRVGTGLNSIGKFASFPATTAVDFAPLSSVLGPNTPASIGWIQQAGAITGYQSIAQISTDPSVKPFLIYQSANPGYYFIVGQRGTSAVDFSASIGPLVSGRLDTFVLTSTGGLGTNNGLSVFRGNDKFDTGGNRTLTGGLDSTTHIGHFGNGNDPWRGLLGCLAIWNRVLSDDEARSFNANPWQLFAEPYDYDDTSLTSDAVTGALSAQLNASSMSASGSIFNSGTFASSTANSTMSAIGSVGAAPSGIFVSTSSNALMSASGNLVASGAFSSISANAAMSANGSAAQPASGAFAVTTADATMMAFGYLGDTPPAVQTRRYRWRILRRFIAN